MKDKIIQIVRNIASASGDSLADVADIYEENYFKKEIDELSTLIQEERKEAVKGLREDILRMSVETADLSFRDGFFKARDIILHNIQEYLDKGDTDDR